MSTGDFRPTDYAILAVYLLATLVVGARFAKQQKTVEDYFVAGRSIAWLPAGISVVATLFSANSFLGVPGESFQHDLKLFGPTPVVMILVTFLVVKLLLPFFMGMKLVSAYEYLERRFSPPVRWCASALFILLRVGWLAVMLYATAIVISEISALTSLQAILLMGAVTITYTLMGGMSAVIWTDFLQFFVFVAGIGAIAVVASMRVEGGMLEIWRIASEQDKMRLFEFTADPTVRMNSSYLIVAGMVTNLATYGADQMVIQRYFTTRSFAESRRTLWFNGIFVIPMVFTLFMVGVVLYVFYHAHPELAAGLKRPDQVLPYFIVHELPVGLSGLVVAAIFAATMSSASAGMNSMATAVIIDFYRRGRRAELPAAHHLKLSRLLTLAFGGLVVVLALFVGRLGSILEIAYKLNLPLLGVLLAVFLLGIMTSRVNGQGALAGIILGVLITCGIVFFTEVSFALYSLVAFIPTFAIGCFASLMWPKPGSHHLEGLTYSRRTAPLADAQAPEKAEVLRA